MVLSLHIPLVSINDRNGMWRHREPWPQLMDSLGHGARVARGSLSSVQFPRLLLM